MTLSRPQRLVTLILSAVSASIIFQSAYTAPNIVTGVEGIRDGAAILGKGVEEIANGGRDAKALGSTHGLGGINDAAHLGGGGKDAPANLKNGLFGDRNAGGAGNAVHSSEITEVGHEGTSVGSELSGASHSDHSPSSVPSDKEPPTAAVDSSKDNVVAQDMARLSGLTGQNIKLVSWEGNLYRAFKAPFSWMLKAYRGRKTAKYMLWLADTETELPQLRAIVAADDFTIAAGVEKRTWLGHILFERLGMVDRTREALTVDKVAPGVRLTNAIGRGIKSLVGGSKAHTAEFGAVPKAWKTFTTPYRWLTDTVHKWQVSRNTRFAGERTAWLARFGTDGVADRFQNNADIAQIVAEYNKQVSVKELFKKGAALISKPKTGTNNAVDGVHGAETTANGVKQT
ncbi:uncharacterized protein MELLADRAFT_117411 [Melampsora larici-populina 98AG31]|uniref:Secreted protein n=1 Tax=Melampsora larici-populina (strain 98AG31 / pathotype 3-4-7) TaxID=747676 RepID=F4RWT7_MELLP|nr:uncharacterized protein MELLADRAFT_117411 [Melampsora larici-populina 98AG31]EGG03168.1 hypothetical protein MELLADRAFT_117411 [Melampsora larici-populina 98AG31]